MQLCPALVALRSSQSSACVDKQVGGLTTNQGFLQRLANHPAFRAAELDTDFIPRHLPSLACVSTPPVDTLALAALGLHHLAIQREASSQVGSACRAASLNIRMRHRQRCVTFDLAKLPEAAWYIGSVQAASAIRMWLECVQLFLGRSCV